MYNKMKMDKNMDVETSEKPVKKVKKVKEPKEKEPKEKEPKESKTLNTMTDLKTMIKDVERKQKEHNKAIEKINKLVAKMK
jgi:hypothetical protein